MYDVIPAFNWSIPASPFGIRVNPVPQVTDESDTFLQSRQEVLDLSQYTIKRFSLFVRWQQYFSLNSPKMDIKNYKSKFIFKYGEIVSKSHRRGDSLLWITELNDYRVQKVSISDSNTYILVGVITICRGFFLGFGVQDHILQIAESWPATSFKGQ